MGVRPSLHKGMDVEKNTSDAVDMGLSMGRIAMMKNTNVLVLGNEDAGMTTFLKRMKFAHGGITESERESYKCQILQNTMEYMLSLIGILTHVDILLPSDSATWCKQLILSTSTQALQNISPESVSALHNLWQYSEMKEAVYARNRNHGLNNIAIYYLQSTDRITAKDYRPTDKDIIYCRSPATGIVETCFRHGEMVYRMLDAGRLVGRKWWKCFEGIPAVIFGINIIDYDCLLTDGSGMNRMDDSFNDFSILCHSEWFSQSSIVLLFTNIDQLSEKLVSSPLNHYFPDYHGGNNHDAACEYLLCRFVSINKNPRRQIYANYIPETSDGALPFIMSAIQDILLQRHLRSSSRKDK